MATEIEIKFELQEPDSKRLDLWLGAHATLIGEVLQVDRYLDNPGHSFFYLTSEGVVDAHDFLRLRTQLGGASVCLKQWKRDDDTGELLSCDEWESTVGDGDAMLSLLRGLGYQERVIVEKRRQIWSTDAIEIALDEVRGLGRFAEVELKREADSVRQGIATLHEFLAKVGFESVRRMSRGYVSMLLNPHVQFGVDTKVT